jgi:hypothetical protein
MFPLFTDEVLFALDSQAPKNSILFEKFDNGRKGNDGRIALASVNLVTTEPGRALICS